MRCSRRYGKGYGTVTGQIFPKTQPAYDPALDTMYPYDPNKAKQLLSDAGYGSGVYDHHAARSTSALPPNTT